MAVSVAAFAFGWYLSILTLLAVDIFVYTLMPFVFTNYTTIIIAPRRAVHSQFKANALLVKWDVKFKVNNIILHI